MKLYDCVITTGKRAKSEYVALAKQLAAEWGIDYRFRSGDSVEDMFLREKVSHVIVVKENRLVLRTAGNEFFFHPNLAQIRLQNIKKAQSSDYLLTALNLSDGMSVLDCTLGFGSDAIIESYATGEKGKVVALEKNPFVAAIIAYGLKHETFSDIDLNESMRRIEVVNTNALDFLQKQADNSFDTVYFDPMFRHPLIESENLRPLRTLADCSPVSLEMIQEAKRVAKHRVVLKENAKSLEFQRLGFNEFVGGKYSKIRYGVMDITRDKKGSR